MPRVHPVKVALAERGQSQKQLAEDTHYSYGTISQVLNFRVEPWPRFREVVASALGRNEDELFPPISDEVTS